MKLFKKEMMQTVKVIILALILTLGVNYIFAVDWTPPTATPPANNTLAPVNVSGTAQSKDGPLFLCMGTCPTNGLLVATGNTGLGMNGIGVGNQPTRRLDVNGDVRIRGFIYDSTNQSGTAGQVLTSTGGGVGGTGIKWAAPSGGSGSGITGGTQNQIAKFLTDTSITNSGITENASGQVGIGVTDPTVKLDINGNIRIRGDGSSSIPGVGKVLTSTANGAGQWKAGAWSLSRTVTSSNNVTNQIQSITFDGRFTAAPAVVCTLSSRTFAGPTSVNVCSVKSVTANSAELYVDNVIGGSVPFDSVLNVMALGA